ncbi:ABC transporter ATP-binding protein [Kitasatospora sp. NPDC008050]|uniref:ABC transporter ATP-binding protein n=1 Tax=Kitasatospora sp. NPDC008050 TaxID=3364021 RepID=UPI0036E5C0EF
MPQRRRERPLPRTSPAGGLLREGARRTRGRLTLLVVLMVLRTAVSLAAPALLAMAVNGMLRGRLAAGPTAGWAALTAAAAVCDTLTVPLGTSCAAHGTRWLRLRTTRHLLGLGARQPLPAGEAVTQVTQAAQQAGALPMSMAQWGVSLTGSIAALVSLWLIDWPCALAFTLAVPVTVTMARRFVSRVTRTQEAYLAAQADIATRLLGALAGARTIRASATLAQEVARVLVPLRRLSAAGWDMWRLQKNTVWQFGLLASLTEALVLALAGLGVAEGRLSPGGVLAVAGYLQIAFQAMQQIDASFALAQARAAAARIATTLEHPPVVYAGTEAADGPGALSLRGVTVRNGGAPVLDRIDLELPAGSSVALVGRTASGKSVLAGLVGRLTDPDEGEVLLDGVPVRELAEGELRRAVTYAFERPALIGATVHEAIAYGRPDLPRAAVERAARAARADGFIRLLPAGYDTPLAAAPMSGGERQRIGLARTLARTARFYVLDDATSGLDTVTEAEVSDAITSALAGRSRLVVAHRVATAARCDLVVWLADGRVRAGGPHAELWRDPAYRAVFAVAAEPGDESYPEREDEVTVCPVGP